MMCSFIRRRHSPIGGASESPCPVESVAEGVSCAGEFIGFLQEALEILFDERVLRGTSFEPFLEFFVGNKGVASDVAT